METRYDSVSASVLKCSPWTQSSVWHSTSCILSPSQLFSSSQNLNRLWEAVKIKISVRISVHFFYLSTLRLPCWWRDSSQSRVPRGARHTAGCYSRPSGSPHLHTCTAHLVNHHYLFPSSSLTSSSISSSSSSLSSS